ncbi:MAG: LapA family protein [Flavobacterium sp.]|nr:LapA family protein [Flavobacterium sp.]
MKTKYIIVLFLLFLIATFLIQNAEILTIKFLFWEFTISFSLVVLISILSGFVMYWLIRVKSKVKNLISNKKK